MLKPVTLVAMVLPLAWLGVEALTGGLGARPVKAALHDSGWWAIWLLVATLAITPIRRLSGWNGIIGVRRYVGVAAFGYAALHLSFYIWDQAFDLDRVLREITTRRYLVIGLIAWVALALLAITSTDGWIRRLRKAWARLHWLVYPAAVLALVHYLEQARLDLSQPMAAIGITAWLFACRRLARGQWLRGGAIGLGIATVIAVVEAGYYGVTRAVPVLAMLGANLDLDAGVRPAMLVACVVVGVTGFAAARLRGGASVR